MDSYSTNNGLHFAFSQKKLSGKNLGLPKDDTAGCQFLYTKIWITQGKLSPQGNLATRSKGLDRWTTVVPCTSKVRAGFSTWLPHGSPKHRSCWVCCLWLLSELLMSKMLRRRVEESCTCWKISCSDSEHCECNVRISRRGHPFRGLLCVAITSVLTGVFTLTQENLATWSKGLDHWTQCCLLLIGSGQASLQRRR